MRVAGVRNGKRTAAVPNWDALTRLILLGTCFFAGTLGGFLFSGLSGESGELSAHLLDYLRQTGSGAGVEPSLLAAVWDVLRWPLAAFLLGFSALGAVGVPVLMLARGFLLSFAAATFGRLFGLPGMAAALAAFGVTALLSVPVLFVVACGAFGASLERLPAAPSAPRPLAERVRPLAPCGGLLVLAAALQRIVMPALLTAVCARLFVP